MLGELTSTDQTRARRVGIWQLDNTSPFDPAGQITSGSKWYFQFWVRDPAAGGAGFKLSDALEVHFSS